MATKKWFVLIGEEEMGPLGPRGLRKLVRKGQIAADTRLRREDHSQAVLAIEVRGLLSVESRAQHQARHPHHRAAIHGPFTSLRPLGWSTAAAMFAFALLGILGIVVGTGQLRLANGLAAGAEFPTAAADAWLFGLGVWAVIALAAVGSLFLWWLWTARVNLPHLINAHVHWAPSWAIASWFVPFVNFARPYAVISETDRLSAEADADGDASVQANHGLLATWWAAALLGTGLALGYMLSDKTTVEELVAAAWLHVAAGLCTVISGLLAGWLVLRITNNQERAHDRHREPVEPHHTWKHKKQRIPVLRVAAE
ncbi:MAG: DUF4328 domain-containing protein [Planctomycetes bacterium]|nr:DUF4328 domain-containing protein [Planctomycetota bacterium]